MKAPDINDVDWSAFGDPVKIKIKRKLFNQWRASHPPSTPGGSPEAFKAYANTIDYIMDHRDAKPNIELQAIWKALTQSDQEVNNLLPTLKLTVLNVYNQGPAYTATQAWITSVAYVSTMVTTVRDIAAATGKGVSSMATMLYDNPSSFMDTVYHFKQAIAKNGVTGLVTSATDVALNLPKELAYQFANKLSDLNDAALKGDDAKVAQAIGDLGGQVALQELFAWGAAKAAAMGVKGAAALGERAAATIEKAALRPSIIAAETDAKLTLAAAVRAGKTEFTVQEMMELGIDSFRAEHIAAVADELGVYIEMTPGNPDGLLKIVNGEALAKPEGLAAAKTSSALDVQLGAPENGKGLSWFKEPVDPGPNASPELRERYQYRKEIWDNPKNQASMEWLKQDPAVRGPPPEGVSAAYGNRYDYGKVKDLWVTVDDDGLVYEMKRQIKVDPVTLEQTEVIVKGKPFGPDLDGWCVRDRDGKMAPPEVVKQVMDRLGLAADVQHGFSAHWVKAPESFRKEYFGKYQVMGGQPLLRFGGRANGDFLAVPTYSNVRESLQWAKEFPSFDL